MSSNDNGIPTPGVDPGDQHGRAALVLVESLIHGLIERTVLTVNDSVEIVETAMDVQADAAATIDGMGAKLPHSHELLSSIAISLRHDLNGATKGPRPAK